MSRIDELIAELCPDGVEFQLLGKVGVFTRGNGLQKKDLTDEGVGAIHYGQVHTYYGIWTTETKSFVTTLMASKLRRAKSGDLVIVTTSEDDESVAKATAWVGEGEVAVSGDAYIYSHTLEPKYVAYLFQSEQFQTQKMRHITGTKVRRISGSSLAKIRIPVPPLEVQREIVGILDKFTQLEAELEAELEARRLQYEYYREELLFDRNGSHTQLTIGEMGRVVTGRTPKASQPELWGHELDFITPSDIPNGLREVTEPVRRVSSAGKAALAKSIIPAGSLLVTCIGADMGKTVINANECVTNQQINSIILDGGVSRDYLFHLLTAKRDLLRRQGEANGSTLPIMNKTDFSKFEVTLPARSDQVLIAAVLNKFDTLVNDISIGLPAELEARRKQYEYYRDKLLTFREAA